MLFGKVPIAPGTIGSIFAVIVWFIFSPLLGSLSIILLFLIALLSYFTISFELRNTNEKDPQHIVIDEAIGMWISLLFISPGNFTNITLAFIIFRLLDILKPSIIYYSQSLKEEYGILMDDILSGLITTLIIINYL